MSKEQERVTIAADELAELVATIFRTHGMTAPDARAVSDVLVWAELSGHGSHGVSRVARYLAFIDREDLDPAAQPQCHDNGDVCFTIDGGRAAGAVAMKLAVAEAAKRARRHGAAFGVVANTTHIGAAGYYVNALCDEGLIGICGAASGPLMSYHGASNATVSTAPLAIGIPAADRPSLVLDMASSVAALGKIRQALADGKSLPPDWALDAEGQPTTDPAKASIQRPMAGPKGSGLALMLECLASLLGSAPILVDALCGKPKRHRQNAFLLAVNVEAFRGHDDFSRDVDELVRMLKAQPRMDGIEEILMPGENSARTRLQRLREGIPLRRNLLQELQDAAEG